MQKSSLGPGQYARFLPKFKKKNSQILPRTNTLDHRCGHLAPLGSSWGRRPRNPRKKPRKTFQNNYVCFASRSGCQNPSESLPKTFLEQPPNRSYVENPANCKVQWQDVPAGRRNTHSFDLFTLSNGSGPSFLFVLALILAPNRHPKSSKILPQSHPKAIRIGVPCPIIFHITF